MIFLDDTRDVPEIQLDGSFAGLIANTAALVTDKVFVTVSAFSSDYRFGPCRWMPRVEPQTVNVAESPEAAHNITVPHLVLPTRGDQCLVIFDESQQPWIAVWEPAS